MAKRKVTRAVLAEKIVDQLNGLIATCEKYEDTYSPELSTQFSDYVNTMIGLLILFRDLLEANPPHPRKGKAR